MQFRFEIPFAPATWYEFFKPSASSGSRCYIVYCKKAGKEYRGYIANFVKETNGTDILAIDYQLNKHV